MKNSIFFLQGCSCYVLRAQQIEKWNNNIRKRKQLRLLSDEQVQRNVVQMRVEVSPIVRVGCRGQSEAVVPAGPTSQAMHHAH